MPSRKKNILFTYTNHTASSTVSLMKQLLAMFPDDQFSSHLLNLTGKQPDYILRDYMKQIGDIYLYFSFDCLGFAFTNYDDTPFFNSLWTPCVTYLTIPSTCLDVILRREMNLNITLLCMTKSEETYIRKNYSSFEDVRTITNPIKSLTPLYSVLLSISERYPLP